MRATLSLGLPLDSDIAARYRRVCARGTISNMSLTTTMPVKSVRRGFILGTAGHIDHGKSALVEALTGTNPDRLPEEKRRGMTIDLGFAHLSLENDSGDAVEIGVVDVPGHEKFVRTMVAGATGIDLAMLVVACDDGIMPQTREHVEILNALGVSSGLIALTKADLADAGRIENLRDQLRDLTQGTTLAAWPVVPCSARTGAGLDVIRATIGQVAAAIPSRDGGPCYRMAIDRVFAVQGRGTVVTGSVLAGQASVGMSLELLPSGLRCKVREIQSHGSDVETIDAGHRAALNLTGIDRAQIERGMELASPGYLRPSRYLGARVRAVSHLQRPIESHQRVRVLMGTREEMATLVVIGGAEIAPGGDALAQLRTARPLVAQFGQHFILRDETAQETIGGGRIIRPVWRRVRPMIAEERESLLRSESNDPLVRHAEWVRLCGFEMSSGLNAINDTGLSAADVNDSLTLLTGAGDVVELESGRWVHRDSIAAVETRTLAFLLRRHQMHPREPGEPRDRLIGWIDRRSAAGCGRRILERLEASRRVVANGPFVAHASFRPALSPEDAAAVEAVVAEISRAEFDPPPLASLRSMTGLSRQRSKVLEDLIRVEPRLTSIGPGHYISTQALEKFKATVTGLGANGRFKLAQVRDALQLNRRVVQLLLEHLDRVRFTRRVGDERELVEPLK